MKPYTINIISKRVNKLTNVNTNDDQISINKSLHKNIEERIY